MRPFAFMFFKSLTRRVALTAMLLLITSGCYGTPRSTFPGSDGGGGSDVATDGDGATCGNESKLCDGTCIPAAACCGPCSCDGLPRTCGADRSEDCCASVLVTGGTFNRDNDATARATVGDFRLDRFEITVGRFNRFIAAGQGLRTTAPQPGSGKNGRDANDAGWDPNWDTYLATTAQAFATNVQCAGGTYLSGDDALPINCITWYEAYAFCIWDGGRLPTEAEWGYAAAGGGADDGQRIFAWSMPPASTIVDSTYAVYSTSAPGDVGSRSPKGDGKWRQADLVGNVTEWVADYAGDYPRPCYDCSNKVVSERRVLRGGDWGYPPLDITSSRYQVVATDRAGTYGARCSRR